MLQLHYGVAGRQGESFYLLMIWQKAVIHTLENKLPEYVYNVGSGKDVTIKALAQTIQRVTGHTGEIVWDATMPDGTLRKLMDVSKLKELGWIYTTDLEDGIKQTYEWFLQNNQDLKEVKF